MADIAYARAGDTHIAYRVIGEPGRVDVVLVAGALFPLESLAEDRVAARFMAGLAALGRLVVFDKRGIGLSDPITDNSRSLQEQWAEDLIAVVEAAGLDNPVAVSWEPMGVARLAASTRPDLFASMVLVNPVQSTTELSEQLADTPGPAVPTRSIEARAFPSRIRDEEFTSWLSRSGRAGASPTTASRIWGHLLDHPGSLTPPGITVRTLVLHNEGCMTSERDARAVAQAIPDATFVQVAGADIYPIAGDVDLLTREIAEYLTGAPSGLAPLRHVAAVLFTDLVASTQRAVDEGDAQWRALLDVHDRTVQGCVRHHSGRVVKYTGDGVLALMPSAAGALEAAQSIRDRLAEQGLHIRVGIHVGDVDERGEDVSGLAVNIAARIMCEAEADETLVSEAARQATLGSSHRFEAVRTTQLKGIPGEWALSRWLP
ncbi:MAG TPA: adenylate/guanylate cyclase domain-containing protein [Acidimicrobiia bacterium]|nr:adenylate/guanylate cyclase domain-containing protein [Acidimicrobiia bacterium]